MKVLARLIIVCAAGGVVSGCTEPNRCIGEGVFAVRANITDSLTGAPLAYRSSLIIRDGAYVDSVAFPGSVADSALLGFIQAGAERAGTYSVTVRREGSKVWTRAGVGVTTDGCEVRQTELTVRLQTGT